MSTASIVVHNLSSGQTFNVPCTADIGSMKVDEFGVLVSNITGSNLQFISAEGRSMRLGTLEKYGVGVGSMIYANSVGRVQPNQVDGHASVTVRIHNERTLREHTVAIEQFDTVEILKLKVWSLSDIPAHEQRIELQGVVIDTGLLVDISEGRSVIFEIFHKSKQTKPSNHKAVRNWYFLGGNQVRPIDPSQWCEYDAEVSFHLSRAYEEMLCDGREEGLLLDLAAFTDPPAPYQVWVGRPTVVSNPRETPGSAQAVCGGRFGRNSVAGFDVGLWEQVEGEMPLTAGMMTSISVHHCYQVRSTHVELLSTLTSYLQDATGTSPLELPKQVGRRAVLMLESPSFFADVATQPPAVTPAETAAESGEEALWQWWWGDARSSRGHWKSYHPHVCRRLEGRWQAGERIIDVDATRYQLEHVSSEHAFDYIGRGGFREAFLPRDVLTLASEVFDDTREIGECFVQFHRSNPHHRRGARRLPPAECPVPFSSDGSPCSLCFSEEGGSLGCAHYACDSCLRRAIRIFSADSTASQGLVCGCYSSTDRAALKRFAVQSDSSLQTLIGLGPPSSDTERAEYEEEVSSSRELMEGEGGIPADLYTNKVARWLEMLDARGLEDLFIACSSPGCPVQNWILKSDFEVELGHGVRTWRCQAGHSNTVLPTEADIDEMNRNLLSHPEFYTQSCMYDSQALRRYRLCKECIGLGKLVLAVHDGACKQWPGGGANVRTHEHCFCFKCCGKWNVDCRHNNRCADPGIQQVRITQTGGAQQLELGYIDSSAYLKCLTPSASPFHDSVFPDTVFPTGRVNGEQRQRQLGMVDRRAMQAEMRRGTS